jgi:hypothetical protein
MTKSKLAKEIDKLENTILESQKQIINIQRSNKLLSKDDDLLERAYKKLDSAYDIIHAKIWK